MVMCHSTASVYRQVHRLRRAAVLVCLHRTGGTPLGRREWELIALARLPAAGSSLAGKHVYLRAASAPDRQWREQQNAAFDACIYSLKPLHGINPSVASGVEAEGVGKAVAGCVDANLSAPR
eukprot:scaffold67818_cov69-Phaeocystis_antarctica.AAC.4